MMCCSVRLSEGGFVAPPLSKRVVFAIAAVA
jgi:hypothetical protein